MLAELILANQPCVALTVAGVSTESGIPDFRSASGIWKQYDPYEVASIDRATALAQEAALLLVVGTSLEVWPVAGLPDETLARGGKLAIVNRDPTSYDSGAALVVHASAGEVLARCVSSMSSS